MAADSLLAPLTDTELGLLGDKLYRALNRFLDAAEDHLYAMESWPSWSEAYKAHERMSHTLMAAYREVNALHADVTYQTEDNFRAYLTTTGR